MTQSTTVSSIVEGTSTAVYPPVSSVAVINRTDNVQVVEHFINNMSTPKTININSTSETNSTTLNTTTDASVSSNCSSSDTDDFVSSSDMAVPAFNNTEPNNTTLVTSHPTISSTATMINLTSDLEQYAGSDNGTDSSINSTMLSDADSAQVDYQSTAVYTINDTSSLQNDDNTTPVDSE